MVPLVPTLVETSALLLAPVCVISISDPSPIIVLAVLELPTVLPSPVWVISIVVVDPA